MSARVIGMGGRAAGDDAVGIAVVEALRASTDGLELFCAGEPGTLVSLLHTASPVVIVDAVIDRGPAGRVIAIDPDALDAPRMGLLSTHGIDVLQALALARALGACAARVHVVGVTIERASRWVVGFTPDIEIAIPNAVQAVLQAIAAWARAPKDSPSGDNGNLPNGKIFDAVAPGGGRAR